MLLPMPTVPASPANEATEEDSKASAAIFARTYFISPNASLFTKRDKRQTDLSYFKELT
jgi:hypothetical protein